MLSAIVHARGIPSNGTLRLTARRPVRNAEGWDVATVRGVMQGDENTLLARYPLGAEHPLAKTNVAYKGLLLESVSDIVILPGGYLKAALEYRGVFSPDGRRDRYSDKIFLRERLWPKNAGTNLSTLANVPGKTSAYGDVILQVYNVAFEWRYVSTTRPAYPGRNANGTLTDTPPASILPALPPPAYAWFINPTYRWPNGWVLTDRDVEHQEGHPLYFTRDTWVYYDREEPGA